MSVLRRGGICGDTNQGMIMNDSNRQLRRGAGLLCLLLFWGANYTATAAPPVVSNVHAAQRSGTGYVDISYDLADPDSSSLMVTVAVSTDAGTTWFHPGASLTGQLGSGIAPGAGKQVVWNAGSDLPAKLFANVRVQVTADDAASPSGMVLIPAGSFTMGNCMSLSEGYSDELPLHTVYVSAFYMDKYLVTKSLWDTVYQWATAHGYTFDYAGNGKASTHPVQWIEWYDCVKWCNARSEKEGRVPAYYADAGLSVRYRSGQVAPYVGWSSGYRLPTEAEWEKAARDGLSGQRFPWGNTISWSQANYYTCLSGCHT
jgi:formylglycine-generating enzyme required for sulfatase activity